MRIIHIRNALFVAGLFMSCDIREAQIDVSEKMGVDEIENFESFYKEFHEDSLFQISRIKFPLPGINTDEMTVEDTLYSWKKGSWLMHHMIDTVLFFRRMVVSDSIVDEEITSNDPGLVVKRKFQTVDGKWYLVLYENVNL